MSQPDPDAWRTQVRHWLATVLEPARAPESATEAADLAVFRNLPEDRERLLLERCRAYQRARFDAGYQALTLPEDKGGAGLTGAHAAVSQPAYLPRLRPWYHASVKSGSVETRSLWIMSCQ